jgi:putative DNA primase/helicase
LDTVAEVIKPFVRKTSASTFLAKDKESTIRSDHAILQGSRLVIGSETPSRRKLDSVAIKTLTGDREFTARPLWAPEVTFRVTFMVTMMTNPLPHVDETDSALWDRLVLVPFDESIPKPERIKDLVEIIVREEASAVLAWLVEGAVDYFQSNDLSIPKAWFGSD